MMQRDYNGRIILFDTKLLQRSKHAMTNYIFDLETILASNCVEDIMILPNH